MYELKEENYEKLVKHYGEEIENKPFGQAVKNNVSPFFVVYQNNKKISNFVIYQNDNNWLAFDRDILKNPELMNFILEKLKPKYEYLTIYVKEKDKNLIKLANDYGFETKEENNQEYIPMKKTF